MRRQRRIDKDQKSWDIADWPGQGRAEQRKQTKSWRTQEQGSRTRLLALFRLTRHTAARAAIVPRSLVRQGRRNLQESNLHFVGGLRLNQTEPRAEATTICLWPWKKREGRKQVPQLSREAGKVLRNPQRARQLERFPRRTSWMLPIESCDRK